ncbi:MAG UNVERIFIED_CONTAM: hypothetical protein LVQ98_07815 [Rickettsiaceae bacterium]|jgi:hypothetical protein
MANKKAIAAVAVLIAGSLYAFNPRSFDCVNVRIDFASLDDKVISKCIPISGEDTALNIFQDAGIKLDGTDKYGLNVICRVDGLPDARVEPCINMPPENAFWALIVKERRSMANLFPKWGWAQEGVSELYLNEGESVGLVFSKEWRPKMARLDLLEEIERKADGYSCSQYIWLTYACTTQ